MDEKTISYVEDYIDGKVEVFGESMTEILYAAREAIGRTIDYAAGRNRYFGYLIFLAQHSVKNIRVKSKPEAQNDHDVQAAVQKVADEWGDIGRILVRKSGTEPVIRVMVEAQCEKCVDYVLDVIKDKGHQALVCIV